MGLINHTLINPHSDPMGLGWSLRICISIKHPGATAALAPEHAQRRGLVRVSLKASLNGSRFGVPPDFERGLVEPDLVPARPPSDSGTGHILL